MKITIDEKECLKKDLTLPEMLITVAIKMNSGSYKETLSDLVERQIITFDTESQNYLVTNKWESKINEIITDSTRTVDDESRLMILAKKMRDCYPEGKMPGTAYYYRCNNREVVLKLKKFFAQYGEYSDDEIIDATKRFVASYNGIYKYLPLIKYFIIKNKSVQDEEGKYHIEEVSELASCLENKGSADLESGEWLMTSRN